MMRRSMGAATVAAMLSTISVVSVGPVWALSCLPDDDALTFQEMIDQRTTGKGRYPVMFLGVVSSLKDTGGDPDGGRTIARLQVVEHPVGYAPPEARVRFWREFSDQGTLYRFQYRHGGRYVGSPADSMRVRSGRTARAGRRSASTIPGSASSFGTPAPTDRASS